MTNKKLEIAPAEYLEFIVERLSKTNGVLLASEMFTAIEQQYGDHFAEADKRLMRLPNGNSRPKWMNNVDWAKATGTRKGKLATVTHKQQRWIVLIDVADEFWQGLAATQKKKAHFKKHCPECGHRCPLSDANCNNCGQQFPLKPRKRRIEA